jgi:hypothetical protein
VELFSLLKTFQSASPLRPTAAVRRSSQHYSQHHHVTISTLYQTNQSLLNKLLLLNTAILESIKQTITPSPSPHQTNADHEHIQSLVLTFFKEFLFLSGHDLSEGTIPQALTGPFLAQLVQSCLFLSQHRYELRVTEISSQLLLVPRKLHWKLWKS